MLNINRGHNRELMEKCRILWEYAEFIGRIRENQKNFTTLEDAVNAAVESSIQDNILADFLKAHRAEVIEVVLTEYDEKGYIAYEKKLSHDQGKDEGLKEGLAEGQFRKLVQMICKKLSKNKTPAQIAEDLEEDIETINAICNIARQFSPDYDADKITEWIKNTESSDKSLNRLFSKMQ